MLCLQPYRQGVVEYDCGRCLPCRRKRVRTWVTRLELELSVQKVGCFATLTYDDAHLPSDGSVCKRALQLFFKRLRHDVAAVRYFACGEYGERFGRPHYHAAIFGTDAVSLVEKAWSGQGFVHVGLLSAEAFAYIAGYVVKGWTNEKVEGLGGRAPEFAIMSRRPGIGCHAAAAIADSSTSRGGAGFIASTGDIPASVRFDGQVRPLGRYLRRKVRGQLGMADGAPEGVVDLGARALAEHLRQPGAVEQRELARIKGGQTAAARQRISSSRRKL